MIRRELTFLCALWKTNLLALMEYRVSFISQILGMMLNNVFYFVFWIIFFDRFENIGGWELSDMFLLFGVVASSIGLAMVLFGNVTQLSTIIAGGRLDYYLSLPRPVLLHALASRSSGSSLGDFFYGIISFFLAGQFSIETFGRFILGTIFATVVFVSFLVIVNSLSFWLGNSSMLSAQALNAIITFSLYPITLFDGTAKLILLTLLPAALVGAVPAELIRSFTWGNLFMLVGAGLLLLFASITIFYQGLKRYESGSAIQVQL